ncbi:uncharacterized protein LOC103714714 isoform X2 [Phoenix dactylifera]|uniref:Uncharacterized protein LOC103714714 isoform X2 n=1 Tax=Phoenix dactylifera TaxID=42345 RepID=A0A8B7CJK3_PHODC|nr:uncharacterized protein LOC103714714 isoform X2 [Phoenix dactylifera]
MALDETMAAAHDFVKDDDDDDDDDYGGAVRFMPDGGGGDIGYRRISRLSIESSDGNDADAEVSEEEKVVVRKSILASLMEGEGEDSGNDWASTGTASLPGTPLRGTPGPAAKEYASETEARGLRVGGGGRRRRRARERWLERSWEKKKRMAEEGPAAAATEGMVDVGECRVLVRPRGGMGTLCMDMEEVKACRDLGLELPRDWTVEIPCALSGSTVDTSSGGNSPIANWRISSPGDDPKDVKARLKVWAQAVALASASRLSS